MFERMSRSFELARNSFGVLRRDKHLLLFPVVSGVACLLVLVSFAVPSLIFHEHLFDADGAPYPAFYPLAFAFYFCNYFVVVFCNSALIHCALMRFNGDSPSLRDGFRAAFGRLPQIFAWSLVSATVGVLLQLVESAHERVGPIIANILGAAWTVMTYFVVPVLVVERVGPFDAIKRSLQILKKTWGEALIGNVGLALFMFVLAIPGVVLAVVGVALVAKVSIAVGAAVLIVALVYFLILAAVSSAMSTIFLGALYQYAACDKVPAGFDEGTLRSAFKHQPQAA
jgi:hypothetical protein